MSVFATASWWHHVGAAVMLLLSPTVQIHDTLGKLRRRDVKCQCGNKRLPLTVALWWTGELSGVQPTLAAPATTATLKAEVAIGNGWMGGCLQPINNNNYYNYMKEEESEPNFPLLSGLILLSVPLTNCIWEFFFSSHSKCMLRNGSLCVTLVEGQMKAEGGKVWTCSLCSMKRNNQNLNISSALVSMCVFLCSCLRK